MTLHQKISLTRRSFFTTAVAASGGLLLGFHIPSAWAGVVNPAPWTDPAGGTEINAWLTIDLDGIVTVRVPHTEMGQGALTSVGMLVAEELNVPWENVRTVLGSANRHVNNGEEYVNMSTGGSNLVRNRHPHIMGAGASARERLKEAAAQKWGVSRDEVLAEQGMLTAGSNTGTYGEFATAAGGISLAEEPKIKSPADWWLLGNSVPRVDVDVKTNGSAIYPIDVQVEGMVFAAVKASPVHHGKVKSVNFDAIKGRPGVIGGYILDQAKDKIATPDLRSAVAVVADTFYRAKTALDLLIIEWDNSAGMPNASTESWQAEAITLLGKEGPVVQEVRGDPRPILAAASPDKIVKSDVYHRPFDCHVPMSPPAAVVKIEKDRVDVWGFTQNTSAMLLLVADQLKVDPKIVFAHGTFQGGAFGNGNKTDVARQAAQLAKLCGRPVKVIWTREEDIGQSRARPPIWAQFSADLGSDGLPTAMLSRVVGESVSARYADRGIANHPYQVANYRHERSAVNSTQYVGPNRAPGNNSNGFAIEQFADEMAIAGGWDPLDWRIKMTEGNERWQRVLNKMKEVSGFTTDLPKGQGMGIGIMEDHGSTVGSIVTVDVTKRGNLAIEKVQIIANSGYCINPLNAEEQIFGAVIWELSHVLYGGLQIADGKIQNLNFDNYPLMRYAETPPIETVFALSEDGWWGGYGEVSAPPTPPALANAIFFATGKRILRTPIIREDLSWS
jgi:isoquinoline 1-oxidoreductase beta subunit